MNQFDVVVVGSGPCAIAALGALPKGKRIAIVTGATSNRVRRHLLHPKIQTVSLEQDKEAGVADPVEFSTPSAPLFATAIVGGLANYWGQQFLRYELGDPYLANVFGSYDAYLRDCEAIEREFLLKGGDELEGPTGLLPGYRCLSPRLLVGAKKAPGAGLLAMRHAFDHASSSANVFSSRVQRLSRDAGRLWSVQLSEGDAIRSPKVVLAAGVVGTAQILLKSFDDISAVSFRDHSPVMLYAYGLSSLLKAVGTSRHFNSLSIEKRTQCRTEAFASLYNMGLAELNLLLASTIGRALPALRGWSAPSWASRVQPVQVWTDRSFVGLEIDARSGRVSSTPVATEADPTLEEMRAMLRALGAKPFHASRTKPGSGFHYHALTVSTGRGDPRPLPDLLTERSDGALISVDSSILPSIGLRPHTLTAMATARRLVLNDREL